ncbi:MAG: acyl--CoA ligase [Myxococcales bacterium]|nr:acyl--CoA ligase [Myxococcales bacterium]
MPLLNQWLEAAARDSGSQRALVYRDAYLSWRGLAHRVERRANELRSLGIGPGDGVGLMLGNVPDMVVLTLALDRLEAIAVPLDPATSARDLDMILDAAPLKALITRPATNTTTPVGVPSPSRRPTPLALRVTDAAKAATPKYRSESKRRLSGSLLNISMYRREPMTFELPRPRMMAFTVDAGGDPKGVLRQDEQLDAIARSLGEALDAQNGQSALLPTPFHYSSAFDAGLVFALGNRLTMELEDEFQARSLARLLRDDCADYVLGTPAQYGALAQAMTSRQPAPRARCLCIQSPGLLAAANAFEEKWQSALLPLWHSAETGPVALDDSVQPYRGAGAGLSTCAGKLLPGVALKVTAPDGSPLPSGVTGQLWLRSGAVSAAAVPQLPRVIRAVGPVGVPIGRADPDGWFRTGDLGFLDATDNRVFLTGREDDLVWVEGRRLALGEVEGCLESFSKIRAAEARVIYDERAGPMVVARVVPSGPCRVEDIIDHCARNLAPYKVPRKIELCSAL